MRKLLAFVLVLLATPAFAADYSTASYSQIETASDDIAARLATITTRATAAKAEFSNCLTQLTALQNDYSTILTGVNALPDTTATDNLTAKLQAFLADRTALVTWCTSLQSAVSGINP